MTFLKFKDVNKRSDALKLENQKLSAGYKVKINAFYEDGIRKFTVVWWKEEKKSPIKKFTRK